jgi:DtxR family Mn-dependent transcriptional regulator
MLTSSAEEYLEAIYRLGGRDNSVRLPSLTEHLDLSAISVNEMVHRLEEQHLVNYMPYHGVLLTEEGLGQALAVLRRHRLWERFLTDILGLPWDTVHEEACRLEHAVSEQVTERLAEFMHHPDRCPHGKPISLPDDQLISSQRVLPLSTLQAGQKGAVAYIAREEPELLRYLQELDLYPDVQITVEEVDPFKGPLKVCVNGVSQVIGHNVASTVFITTQDVHSGPL